MTLSLWAFRFIINIKRVSYDHVKQPQTYTYNKIATTVYGTIYRLQTTAINIADYTRFRFLTQQVMVKINMPL